MILINKNSYPEKTVSTIEEAKQFRDTARTKAEYSLFSMWFYSSEMGEKEISIDSFNQDDELNDDNLFQESEPEEKFRFETGERTTPKVIKAKIENVKPDLKKKGKK